MGKEDKTTIYPVWLRPDEARQIIAIYEKTGALATVVSKIHSAMGIRNTK